MSYVIATPEIMTAAAADLATIGSTLDEAHRAAAAATRALVPAAADEVSVSIAHLFSEHAQDYHAVAAQAAAVQQQFVQNLKSSAVSYASVEDAIASFLQGLILAAESSQQLDQLVTDIQKLLFWPFLLLFTPIGWLVDIAVPLYLFGLLEQFLGQYGL